MVSSGSKEIRVGEQRDEILQRRMPRLVGEGVEHQPGQRQHDRRDRDQAANTAAPVWSVEYGGFGVLVVAVMVMTLFTGARCLAPLLRGEGWGEGLLTGERTRGEAPSSRHHISMRVGLSRMRGGGLDRDATGFHFSNPEQARIACLDFFRHFLDPRGILFHQLDVGCLSPVRASTDLRMNGILCGEVDEELLGLAGMPPGLEKPRGIGCGADSKMAVGPESSARPRPDTPAPPASFSSTTPYSLPSAITARSPSDSFFGGSVED